MIKNILLLTVAAFVISGCSSKKETEKKEEDMLVKVSPIEEQEIARTLEYSANLEADEQVYYAPALSGSRIRKIYVEVGDRIKKGQLLVEMETSSLQQSQIQLKNLETEYNRAVKLNETGSISKQNYDAAVTQYEVAKSSYDHLLENTRMLAPFNGVVTGKYMEEGELYTGAAFGGAGKPSVISIEKINPIKAYVNLSEQYYLQVKKGMKVHLNSEIYGDRTFEGKVNIVYPTIDPSSRTFKVELLFANNDEALRPGMYGTIEFNVNHEKAIVVPAIAVLKVQGSNDRYLFIVRDGKAERIGVKIGKRFEDMVEVISQDGKVLNQGDQLIVVGQARVVDGAVVKIEK